MIRIVLLFLILPTLVTAAPIDSTTIANLGDWETATLDLEVEIAAADSALTINGNIVLELKGDPSTTLALLLNSRRQEMLIDNMSVASASGTDPESIRQSRYMGAGVNDSMTVVLLTFPRAMSTGDRVTVEFGYHSVGQSMQVLVRPDMSYASWVEAWYPLPADGANPNDPHTGARARAKGTTRFRLPSGWRALSNGRLVGHESTTNGVVDTWLDDYGAARSFVAAPFMAPHEVIVGDRTVAVYLLTEKPFGTEAMARQLSAAIDAQSKCFGPYPYATFAIAEVPNNIDGFGAASEQGFIVAKTQLMDVADGNLALFAHEAGHTWWGNLVSSSGPGQHLVSESLAQYSAYVAIEAVDGVDAARDFLEFSRPGYIDNQCARGYFAYVRANVDRPMSELDGNTRFDHALSDAKGHWIHHMLREKVGDDVFFATLRGIVTRYQQESFSLAALRQEFQEVAPEADLDVFFEQWLDRIGAPVLDVDWTLEAQMIDSKWTEHKVESILVGEEDGPFDVTVHIDQVHSGEPYVLDVEIEFEHIDGTTSRHVIPVHERTTSVTIQTDGIPHVLRLDPDRRILMWRHHYGPRPDATAGDADSVGVSSN